MRSFEHEIWDLHSAGYTIRAIARELSLARSTVHRIVARLRGDLTETLDDTLDAITERHTGLTDAEMLERERAENDAELVADPTNELARYRQRHFPRVV